MSDHQPLICVQHVDFNHGSAAVLSDITLEITRGDFLAIIGPNGSGKTTLLKLILGTLRATSGRITLFGQEIEKFSQWSKLGLSLIHI